MSVLLPSCAARRFSAAHLRALEHMLRYHKSTRSWAVALGHELEFLKTFYSCVERFFLTPRSAPPVVNAHLPFKLAVYMSPSALSDAVASVADDLSTRLRKCEIDQALLRHPDEKGLNVDARIEAIRHEFMTLCAEQQ